MADLSRVQGDLPTMIVGATSTGSPTTPVASDTNGNMYVNAAIVAAPTDYTITGSLTSGTSVVSLTGINGASAANIDISGSGFVGTIVVQEITTSQARNLAVQALTTSAYQSTITANGNYRVFGLAATSNLQVAFSSYTSGSATVTIRTSTGTNIVQSTQLNAANLLTTSYTADGSGNPLSSINSGLLVADIINTGSQFRAQSVTTTAAQALGGATALTNRKFVQITPTNGTIYYGTSSSVTSTTGTPVFSNQTLTCAFGTSVQLWVVAGSGTVDTRVLEGA